MGPKFEGCALGIPVVATWEEIKENNRKPTAADLKRWGGDKCGPDLVLQRLDIAKSQQAADLCWAYTNATRDDAIIEIAPAITKRACVPSLKCTALEKPISPLQDFQWPTKTKTVDISKLVNLTSKVRYYYYCLRTYSDGTDTFLEMMSNPKGTKNTKGLLSRRLWSLSEFFQEDIAGEDVETEAVQKGGKEAVEVEVEMGGDKGVDAGKKTDKEKVEVEIGDGLVETDVAEDMSVEAGEAAGEEKEETMEAGEEADKGKACTEIHHSGQIMSESQLLCCDLLEPRPTYISGPPVVLEVSKEVLRFGELLGLGFDEGVFWVTLGVRGETHTYAVEKLILSLSANEPSQGGNLHRADNHFSTV